MIAKEQIRKEVKAYLKPVRKLMKFSKETKETLYMTVEGCAIDFLNANPKATMDDVHELWGVPDEWVNQFSNSHEMKAVEKRHKRVKIAIVCGAAVLALTASLLLFNYMRSVQTMTLVENPTVIYKTN